jgi:hypothetical protein
MKCVSTSVFALTSVFLLSGVALPVFAQEVAEDLRLDTQVDLDANVEEETIVPPVTRAPTQITIGDDSTDTPRRRRSTVDPYAAQGLPAGAFRLFPSLEIGTVISSNARRSSSNAEADVGLRVKPQLRVESNWVRHSLTGSASFEAQQFLDNTDIKTASGSVQGALRLDVRRTTTSDIDWSYTATSTGIEDNDLPDTATGARLDHTIAANAGVTHDFGGLDGRLRFGVSRNLFGDVDLTGGGTEDNKDRNYTQLSIAARAALRTGGKIQPFGEVAYEPRVYDKKKDRNGTNRNSQGLRVSAGVSLSDDPIWSGDIAASLELRDYSDESLGTAIAPGFLANVSWRPTDLTRFEFNSGVSLTETVAAGVAATQSWTLGTNITHALRENLEVEAGLSTALERVDGDSTLTSTGTLGVNWTLNPSVVLGASYEGTFVNAPTSSGDYSDHRLLTSIILRR